MMQLSEHEIQRHIVDFLKIKKIVVFECDVMSGLQFFSHTDNRRFSFINHHKNIGYIPGQPDLVVVMQQEIIFAEIKTAKGKQSEEQHAFQKAVELLGYRYEIWRSIDDCINTMRKY